LEDRSKKGGFLLAGLEGGGGLWNGQRLSLEHKRREKNRDTHLNGVLILAGERVDSALLDALLALGEALVPESEVGLAGLVRQGADFKRGRGEEMSEDNKREKQKMRGEESAYFPTAMIASRVYLGVVGRQTKVSHHGASEGFEILVRVGWEG